MQNESVTFFDDASFFENGEKVHIQFSTEFPDFVGVSHEHAFIEIVYVLSGRAVHTVGGKEYQVKSGDVILINERTPHKFTSVADEKEKFVTYDLMFSPKFFASPAVDMQEFHSLKNNFLFYSLFPEEAISQPDLYVPGGRYLGYGELFSRMYQEYRQKKKGYIQMIRAYTITLLIQFFRDVERADGMHLSPDKLKTVYNTISYMETHYDEKLSVETLAKKAFLAPDYFRKVFKRVTGETVTEYLQGIRIDKACKLLSTTDMAVSDVCAKVGYNDATTFFKAFKKITGKTPNAYRKTQ